jgi:hypothetical protein
VEILVAVAAPVVVPDYKYLSLYLSKKAVKNTELYLLDKDPYLIWDDNLGWRNRPNSGKGNWQVDEHGSRTTHPFTVTPGKETRILFLGSSLTNGGMRVAGNETISALIEDSLIESLNFGTMLYSLDQMYLAYAVELYKYNPNIIVVGLPANPGRSLGNRYVPFASKKESNMPFVKPRFSLDSGRVTLIPVPNRQDFAQILKNPEFLAQLKETDDYYGEFEWFRHAGLMPLSSHIWLVQGYLKRFGGALRKEDDSLPLLDSLMGRLVDEAEHRKASVIFMILPDRATVQPGSWRRLFPDDYQELIDWIKSRGYDLIDMRTTLIRSNRNMAELYAEDNVHFSSEGNAVIAGALKRRIVELRESKNPTAAAER